MLETPHVAVGALIATKIPNPWVAIPLAFASHFVLDMVPHWNPHLNTEKDKYGHPTKKSTIIVAVDSSIALLTGSYIAYRALPNWHQAVLILACSFVSVLPDLIEGPYFFLNIRSKLIRRWIEFQKSIQVNVPFIPGMVTQLLTIAAALFWLKN